MVRFSSMLDAFPEPAPLVRGRAPFDKAAAAFSWRTAARAALPGSILAILCLLPYWNKAFGIDDPVFLLIANQILKSPLHPMRFELCWSGHEICSQASNLAAGHTLGGYLLVPVILGGGAEWIAHLIQMIV